MKESSKLYVLNRDFWNIVQKDFVYYSSKSHIAFTMNLGLVITKTTMTKAPYSNKASIVGNIFSATPIPRNWRVWNWRFLKLTRNFEKIWKQNSITFRNYLEQFQTNFLILSCKSALKSKMLNLGSLFEIFEFWLLLTFSACNVSSPKIKVFCSFPHTVFSLI